MHVQHPVCWWYKNWGWEISRGVQWDRRRFEDCMQRIWTELVRQRDEPTNASSSQWTTRHATRDEANEKDQQKVSRSLKYRIFEISIVSGKGEGMSLAPTEGETAERGRWGSRRTVWTSKTTSWEWAAEKTYMGKEVNGPITATIAFSYSCFSCTISWILLFLFMFD